DRARPGHGALAGAGRRADRQPRLQDRRRDPADLPPHARARGDDRHRHPRPAHRRPVPARGADRGRPHRGRPAELMKKYLASVYESLIDGIVDINSHRSRSILQVLGVVLGVASVVATFGLIEGGKRQMTEVYDQTGGIRKMRIDEKQTTEATQTAQQKASRGLTYDDALTLRREAHYIEIVEPTMQRQALVKAAGFEKTLDVSGATWGYEPMYNFHPAE